MERKVRENYRKTIDKEVGKMILAKNMDILKERYPAAWNLLNQTMEGTEKDLILQAGNAKNGYSTLKVDFQGKTVYLHSSYNPLREAESIIDSYTATITLHKHVIFYGVGLGYHIDEFVKRYPDIYFTIYEPVPEVFSCYLSRKSLNDFSLKKILNIFVGQSQDSVTAFNQHFDKIIKENPLIIALPSYQNVFAEKYNNFLSELKLHMLYKKINCTTYFKFEKIWMINLLKNFPVTLNTPNIYREKKLYFENKPAVIVSAGPSLEDEIENLRHIKEEGLAYIFSAGSAINTLLDHNIQPHAVFSVDGNTTNIKVYEKVIRQNITTIPMVFTNGTNFETLELYPGQKLSAFSVDDYLINYYLHSEDEVVSDRLQPAGSVSIMSLQLLDKLGVSPIILVGQNLAYRDKQYYASGIKYYNTFLSEEQIKTARTVEDVYGNLIYTNEQFDVYRDQLEKYLKISSDCKTINTTKGGAKIEGTQFCPLEEVIENTLTEQVVEENWYKGSPTIYDLDYLIKQKETIDKDYDDILKILDQLNSVLDKLEKYAHQQNKAKIQKHFPKIGKNIRRLEKNKYYQVVLQPMNQLRYELLGQTIDMLADTGEDIFLIVKETVEAYRRFIIICKQDFEMIDPFFKDMNQELKKVIDREKK